MHKLIRGCEISVQTLDSTRNICSLYKRSLIDQLRTARDGRKHPRVAEGNNMGNADISSANLSGIKTPDLEAMSSRSQTRQSSGALHSGEFSYALLRSTWTTRATRIAIGALLLFAAISKSYQLVTEPAAHATGWLDSSWFLFSLVEFELVLGALLVLSLFPRATWFVALGTFSTFAVVAAYRGFAGAASCGCFGALPVNPWLAAAVDLAAILGLVVWPAGGIPSEQPSSPSRLAILAGVARARGAAIPLLVLGILSTLFLSRHWAAELTEDGLLVGSGHLVVLEPSKWVDKPFPLARYIAAGERLMQGEWIVLLYHHDCPKCQEVIPHYERLAEVLARQGAARRVALVEMPPYGHGPPQNRDVFHTRLSNAKRWFGTTPIEIDVYDGRVTNKRAPDVFGYISITGALALVTEKYGNKSWITCDCPEVSVDI